jgi:hypothetical protein
MATAAQVTEGSGAATKASPGSATATATGTTVGTAATGTVKPNSGSMAALASYDLRQDVVGMAACLLCHGELRFTTPQHSNTPNHHYLE